MQIKIWLKQQFSYVGNNKVENFGFKEFLLPYEGIVDNPMHIIITQYHFIIPELHLLQEKIGKINFLLSPNRATISIYNAMLYQ